MTPDVHLAGLPQCTSERLEGGLHDVMTVGAAQLPNVQRHAGCVRQGLEEMLHQLGLIFTDALCRGIQVTAEVRPPRQVLREEREICNSQPTFNFLTNWEVCECGPFIRSCNRSRYRNLKKVEMLHTICCEIDFKRLSNTRSTSQILQTCTCISTNSCHLQEMTPL